MVDILGGFDYDKLKDKVISALQSIFNFTGDAVDVNIKSSDLAPVIAELRDQDETVAQEMLVDLGTYSTVEVLCKADAATTFTLIISFDGVTEERIIYQSSIAETEHCSTYSVGAQYLIVKSAAAGVAGNKVTLLVGAK